MWQMKQKINNDKNNDKDKFIQPVFPPQFSQSPFDHPKSIMEKSHVAYEDRLQ